MLARMLPLVVTRRTVAGPMLDQLEERFGCNSETPAASALSVFGRFLSSTVHRCDSFKRRVQPASRMVLSAFSRFSAGPWRASFRLSCSRVTASQRKMSPRVKSKGKGPSQAWPRLLARNPGISCVGSGNPRWCRGAEACDSNPHVAAPISQSPASPQWDWASWVSGESPGQCPASRRLFMLPQSQKAPNATKKGLTSHRLRTEKRKT